MVTPAAILVSRADFAAQVENPCDQKHDIVRHHTQMSKIELLACATKLALGGLLLSSSAFAADSSTQHQRFNAGDRDAVETIIRAYLLEHPEIIPEAMAALETRERDKRIAAILPAIEKPFANAFMGNPDGDVVVVEFYDYACGYCKQSVADIEQLIKVDPGVKVVFRGFPILGPVSLDAARLSLAAAQSTNFIKVHHDLFAASQLDEKTIKATLRKNNLSLPKDLSVIDAEFRNNNRLAREIGMSGTPAFIINGRFLSGAVGFDELKKQVDQARLAKSKSPEN